MFFPPSHSREVLIFAPCTFPKVTGNQIAKLLSCLIASHLYAGLTKQAGKMRHYSHHPLKKTFGGKYLHLVLSSVERLTA